MQRIALLPRAKLHDAAVPDIADQPLENLPSQAGARHFAAAKKDRGFHFVAFIEKTQNVVLFGVVIVVIHVDAKFYFLDGDCLLVFLGFALFLFLLVEILPVIHDAANRGLRRGRNLDQIQVLFAGQPQRFVGRHDADLLAFIIYHANFACANALIGADKTLVDRNLRWFSLQAKREAHCGWEIIAWSRRTIFLHSRQLQDTNLSSSVP